MLNNFFLFTNKFDGLYFSNNLVQQNQTSLIKNPIDEVIYDSNLNMEVEGMQIKSIIGFVFNRVGINSKGSDEKESYEKYCAAFREMLGSSEPLQVSSSLEESNKNISISRMLSLLPILVENLTPNTGEKVKKTPNTEVAIRKSWLDVLNNISSYSIQACKSYKETALFENIEYTVIKVSKSGDNVEITPSYMKINRKLVEKKSGLHSYSDSDSTAEYMHEKFVLTQFDCKEIIDIIEKPSQSIDSN